LLRLLFPLDRAVCASFYSRNK